MLKLYNNTHSYIRFSSGPVRTLFYNSYSHAAYGLVSFAKSLCERMHCSNFSAQLFLMIILCIFGAHVFKFGFVQMDYLRTYLYLYIYVHRNRITFVSTKLQYFLLCGYMNFDSTFFIIHQNYIALAKQTR